MSRFVLSSVLSLHHRNTNTEIFTRTHKQDHRYTYTAVRNRKRRDRALQALVIGTVVAGVGKAALWAAKAAARVILKG